ncbi:hypothetical protein ID875_23665 [Streptomyces globisporus]|uniref:Uncharacterized protein n=1 Tax=Streptomyces globisporus TaxID=1908 RepID=A0A927GP44_STRGL|nr:hypothetical protein [Streptomyces globisporus]
MDRPTGEGAILDRFEIEAHAVGEEPLARPSFHRPTGSSGLRPEWREMDRPREDGVPREAAAQDGARAAP